MKSTWISTALIASLTTSVAMASTETEMEALKARIAELEKKTELLIEETTDIKSGVFSYTEVDASQSLIGMGDGASKVYYSKSPLSIGGYGEMYYSKVDDGDGETDIYRFVPYIGYKFSDSIILNTELEFEHSGEEVAVEFMYLDFLFNDSFNLRVGHMLVPMGLVNVRHEPTLFNTIQRPEVERYLIPSTWHETGILAYGNIGESGLNYTAGFVNALDLYNDGTNPSWIRDGRIKGTGEMNRVAAVARLDYTGVNGLLVGASGYYGDAAQGHPSGSTAIIYDVHGTYENSGFKFKGLYTATMVNDAEEWNEPLAATDARGYYVNGEYDLFASRPTTERLPLFVQYESYNTTTDVVTGSAPDNKVSTTTVGLNYFPHAQVVLKMDYAMKDYRDDAQEDEEIFSLGLGFVF